MNIKTVETLTGMTRSNIRFYELEGFISPSRQSNGYREYSDEDIEILKRIKLLRSLHVSLDTIKELHQNTTNLSLALEKHIQVLESEKEQIDDSIRLTKMIYNHQCTYQTLKADDYLNLENISMQSIELKKDIAPYANVPIRRFLARIIDLLFYKVIWYAFLMIFLNFNCLNHINFLNILIHNSIVFLVMVLIEPIFLKFFATTPGKWCLGLHIHDQNGKNLTYLEGLERTWQVLIYGFGFQIPLLNIYCLIKSAIETHHSQSQWWEYHSTLIYEEPKIYKYILFLFLPFVYLNLFLGFLSFADLPTHLNQLTIKEYAQNYNDYVQFYDLDTDFWVNITNSPVFGYDLSYNKLTEDGTWEPLDYVKNIHQPKLEFECEKNTIQKISYKSSYMNTIVLNKEQIIFFMKSFVQAQIGFNPFNDPFYTFLKEFNENPYQEYDVEYHGIHIYYNYEENVDIENTFTVTFVMEKK